MTRRCVIYTRISVADDDSVSIGRQLESCRALCADRGLPVVFEVQEQLSAFKAKVRRPKWEQVLKDIEDGKYDVLVAYRLDRLTRSVEGAVALLNTLEKAGCALVLYSGQIDTTTAQGIAMFQLSAVFGQLEAAIIQERVKAASEAAARKGGLPYGGHRCFGYNRDGSIVKSEAKVIHQAADKLVAGESLRSVTRWLSTVSQTTAGNDWQTRSVKQLLTSPRLRGVRVHNGQMYQGTWKPIFTESQQIKLISALDGAKAYWGSSNPYGEHLLSGLLRCGKCGSNLVHGKISEKGGGTGLYRCAPDAGQKRCGGISVNQAKLDQYVIEAVNYYGPTYVEQSRPRALALEDEIHALEVELAATQSNLKALMAERFKRGVSSLSDVEYANMADPLISDIEEMTKALDRLREHHDSLPGEKFKPTFRKGAFWTRLEGDITEQREYLRTFLDAIVIAPSPVKGGQFDVGRITLVWRGGEVTNDRDLLHLDNS